MLNQDSLVAVNTFQNYFNSLLEVALQGKVIHLNKFNIKKIKVQCTSFILT